MGNWKRKNFQLFPESKGSPVWAEILMFSENFLRDEKNAKKMAVIATLYGYPNYAFSILKDAGVNFDEPKFIKNFNGVKFLGKTVLKVWWPTLH